jgi:hypothetical protein
VLTELVSWGAIFFVNVPIGIVTIVSAALRLRPSAEPEGTPLDWSGSATFALALLGLVFALVEGNPLQWTSPVVLGALVVAVVSGSFCVRLQRARPSRPLASVRCSGVAQAAARDGSPQALATVPPPARGAANAALAAATTSALHVVLVGRRRRRAVLRGRHRRAAAEPVRLPLTGARRTHGKSAVLLRQDVVVSPGTTNPDS